MLFILEICGHGGGGGSGLWGGDGVVESGAKTADFQASPASASPLPSTRRTDDAVSWKTSDARDASFLDKLLSASFRCCCFVAVVIAQLAKLSF